MKVIFLDRDGVINKYPGDKKYVTSWKDFKFLPHAKEAIRRLHENNFKLFVISNQAGVGKKVFSQAALDEITDKMLREVKKSGGSLEGVYYCTHRQEDNCPCRKPKAGLLEKVKATYPLNLANSFFIGDTIRDVNTAKAAGVGSILVFSGKEKLANRKNWGTQPDFFFKNLDQAVNFILKYKPTG